MSNKKKYIPDKLIEEVKSRINLLDFALAIGLKPLPGYKDRFPCPWRPGADSNGFHVTPDAWYDYVDNECGDAIEFVRKLRNCDFPTAVSELADHAGIKEPKDKNRSQPKSKSSPVKQKITATYDYRDETGKLIFQSVRFEPGKGGRDKEFKQRRPGKKGGWIWTLKGINKKPLYRLSEWINSRKTERLFIVEGEKDADNLSKLEIKATCNAGGAGNWNLKHYNEYVSGHPIVIIPDNDPKGKRHYEIIVPQLWGKVPSIRILNLPDLKFKGDISDWIEIQRNKNLTDEQIRSELLKLVSATASLTETDVAEIKDNLKAHESEKNRENARGGRSRKNNKENITPKVLADMFFQKHSINGLSRYRSHRGAWYLYHDHSYRQIMADDLRASVMKFLRKEVPFQALNSTRNNVIGNLDSVGIANAPSYWQPPFWFPDGESASGWLAMKNCLLNIENLAQVFNGEKLSQNIFVRDHTPQLFSSFATPYDYDPHAKCPRFEDYLHGVQPDPQAREIIQMLYGLSLVPDTRYEVVFILFGESGTGKSVCLHILEHLVGVENCCCLPLSKFTEKHSLHLLTENLLNIVGDLPTNDGRTSLHGAEGTLKDTASGGNLPIELKGKDPLSAPAIARNIFGTNELPPFADRSNGIWSRLRIIPFNQVFRDTNRDNKNLKYEIVREELPGIFIWAVHGLAMLRNLSAFPECPGGLEQKQKHRANCDHEREYLNEYYEECRGSYMVKAELYRAYRNFCTDSGYRPKNAANFYQAVKRVFPSALETRQRVAEGNVRIFENIAKRSEI